MTTSVKIRERICPFSYYQIFDTPFNYVYTHIYFPFIYHFLISSLFFMPLKERGHVCLGPCYIPVCSELQNKERMM